MWTVNFFGQGHTANIFTVKITGFTSVTILTALSLYFLHLQNVCSDPLHSRCIAYKTCILRNSMTVVFVRCPMQFQQFNITDYTIFWNSIFAVFLCIFSCFPMQLLQFPFVFSHVFQYSYYSFPMYYYFFPNAFFTSRTMQSIQVYWWMITG